MRLLQLCVGIFVAGWVSGDGDTFKEFVWIDGKEFESQEIDQIHICRGQVLGNVFIGTFTPGVNTFCVSFPEKLSEFEVLVCAPSAIWTPVFGNILPHNIYSFSKDHALYACRDLETDLGIGVVKRLECANRDISATCEEKFICEIFLVDEKTMKTLDNFTVFTTTNTMIQTDHIEYSETYDLVSPLQIRSLSFNVKSDGQIKLFLTDDSIKFPLFEILIGGLQNSITAIRKGGYKMFSNSTHTMDILEKDCYVSFWIYWGNGVLGIGRADKYLEPRITSTEAVINFKDSGVFAIKKFAMLSDSEASWHFFFG